MSAQQEIIHPMYSQGVVLLYDGEESGGDPGILCSEECFDTLTAHLRNTFTEHATGPVIVPKYWIGDTTRCAWCGERVEMIGGES